MRPDCPGPARLHPTARRRAQGRHKRFTSWATVAAAVCAALTGPVFASPLLAEDPVDGSVGSARLVFWAAVIILAIAQVTLIAVELRRKRSVPAAEFPRLTGRALEVVWLVLPALLLALLVFFTWPTLGYTK